MQGYKSFSLKGLPRQEVGVQNKDFSHWSANYQYRTSYRDASKPSMSPPKKYVIPGYAGFIPGAKADNSIEKGLTQMSKEQFNRDFFRRPRTGNVSGPFGGGVKDTYHTVSRHYGKSTLPAPHPNISFTKLETSYASSFMKSEHQRISGSARPSFRSSGFVKNNIVYDRTEGYINGPMATEYAKSFTPRASYHPQPLKPNTRLFTKRRLFD